MVQANQAGVKENEGTINTALKLIDGLDQTQKGWAYVPKLADDNKDDMASIKSALCRDRTRPPWSRLIPVSVCRRLMVRDSLDRTT